MTVVGASGGAAEEAGFTVNTGGSTVLGFSFSGSVIPEGNGLLTFVETADGSSDGCIEEVIVSSTGGGNLSVDVQNCNVLVVEGGFVEPVYGCTDADACNYNPLANTDSGNCEYPEDGFNCSGDCVVGVDCNGVCGGSGVEDCAGECNGDAVVDECGECGGDGIADGACDCSGAVVDACGVCGLSLIHI